MKDETASKLVIVSEILFVVLPIIVITFVFIFKSNINQLLKSHEWSFASIVLFGQTIVKFSSGISNYADKKRWELVAIILTFIIVIGLVPSIIVLVTLLTQPDSCLCVYIVQFILFVLSIFCFFNIGAVGQYFLSNTKKKSTNKS